jgi:hypothetical protein
MANRLTQIPAWPVPHLPGPVRVLIPLADLFMIAMVSRPSTGSLRNTWVTPATRWLTVVAALLALVAVITLRPAQAWLAIIEVVVLAFVIAGSAAVAVVAFSQDRALR